jgi:hypothetical protein
VRELGDRENEDQVEEQLDHLDFGGLVAIPPAQ